MTSRTLFIGSTLPTEFNQQRRLSSYADRDDS